MIGLNIWNKALIPMTVIMVLALPGCQSATYSTPTPSPAPSSSPASTPAHLAYTINIASKAGIGDYLNDGKGMTLYYFAKDSVGKSTATASVIANWPVFNAANFFVPSQLNAADFGTITRDDGLKQTTYKDWPLYYYVKDQVAGDTSGQSLNNVWFVINPAGFPPQPAVTSTAQPTPTASPAAAVTIDLIAQGYAFDKKTITVPAGAAVLIHFNNKDAAPHNFALYQDSTAAKSFFVGNVVTSSAIDYKFTAPVTPGTYFFRCDFHPTMMTGSFIVQ